MTIHKKTKGFTLIELMIVVAIVGILAGIAYPSYVDSVQKSRRSDAMGALLGFANAMERRFTETNSYCDAAGTGAGTAAVANCGAATNDTGSPSIYPAQSPLDGGTKYYNLTIDTVTASTYILHAARIDTQAQANDKCGTLTLNQTGTRGITGGATGVTATDCWK